jgi:hypothetical protein
MKTPLFFRTVLLTALVMNGLFLLASTEPTNTLTLSAEKTIRDYFRFPQILLPHPGTQTVKDNKVQVVFTTGRDGRVNFVSAATEDAMLKKEIEKQFYKLTLQQLRQEVAHTVVLNFKTQ